ncbi:MAG: hypothetical protein ISS74_01010, partial [Planctomycetes bacterium]|nr:hypothetical protein [Planctomycetota bacterium]
EDRSGFKRRLVVEHKGELHPRIIIEEGKTGGSGEDMAQRVKNDLRKQPYPDNINKQELAKCRDKDSAKIAEAIRLGKRFGALASQLKEGLTDSIAAVLKSTPREFRKNYLEGDPGFEVAWFVTHPVDQGPLEADDLRDLEGALIAGFADEEWGSRIPRLNRQSGKSKGHPLAKDVLTYISKASNWHEIVDVETLDLSELANDPQGVYFIRPRGEPTSHGYVGLAGRDKAKKPESQGLQKRMLYHVRTGDWSKSEDGKALGTDNSFIEAIVVDYEMRQRLKVFNEVSRSESSSGKILEFHYIPARTYVEVEEGQKVQPGTLLARRPREVGGTQDITGGLPRVTELFEARKPKEPAVMSEIDGVVELSQEKKRGKMTIIVRNPESEIEKEHYVPHDRHLRVHTGDQVHAGDQLTDGPLVPHDILRISGESELQKYMLREVQNVYRSQKQAIDDKHVETILSQMLGKVRVDRPGDTAFLPGEVVNRFKFRAENERLHQMVKVADPGDTEFEEGQLVLKSEFEEAAAIAEQGGGEPPKKRRPKPGTAKTMLLGITKASLQSDSFLSAASFQETTKVLTEAALAGKIDPLIGLKENVVLGHLIPAGTGFKPYLEAAVCLHAQPVLPARPELEEMPAVGSEVRPPLDASKAAGPGFGLP